MHEVVPGARAEGEVLLDGEDIYAPDVDPVQVRRRIGMVFQKPTPFPTMSIEDNVAAGLKLNGVSTQAARSATGSSERACARRRCGTRSRIACAAPAPASRAASSSACASRARSRSSPRCC